MIFQETVGIDIQHTHLTLIFIKGAFRGVGTVAHAHFELDKNQPITERMRNVADRYREFAVENKINDADIHVGLARDLFFIRTLTLPLSVKENLSKTLRYEMDKYVPIPLDAIYFDFIPYGESKKNNTMNVLLIVAKRADIDPYFELSRLIPTGIAGVEPTPIAVMNGLSHVFPSTEASDRVLVSIDRQRVHIDFAALGMLQGWKMIDEENLNATTMTDRVNHEVDAFAASMKHDPHDIDVIVHERGGHTDRLETLVKGITYPVRRLQEEPMPIPSVDFAGAFGLALEGQTPVPMVINLLPDTFRRKKGKTGYYLMMALSVLLLIAIAGWVTSKVTHQQMIVERLQTEIGYLQSEARHVETVDAEIGDIEKRIAFLDNMVNSNVSVADVLQELSTRIPASAWVQTLDLSGAVIKLKGDAESASSLVTLLEAAPMFEDVKFLSTITKTSEGRETYHIGLKLAKQQR